MGFKSLSETYVRDSDIFKTEEDTIWFLKYIITQELGLLCRVQIAGFKITDMYASQTSPCAISPKRLEVKLSKIFIMIVPSLMVEPTSNFSWVNFPKLSTFKHV